MSTRDDASLTDRERAALAALEAIAAADDPQLASRLKGSGRLRLIARLPRVPSWIHSSWWSAPLTVVGLILVVLGLSTTWLVGVVGLLLAAYGLWLAARVLERRLQSTPPSG